MQNSLQKTGKAVISLLLAVAIIFSVFAVGTISAFAATSTGVGLSAYCLNAYYEQWDYVWGGTTPGAVDCSGLIYSYNGVGGIRTDMLASSSEWGYVSSGIPRIHGLGLHMPGHVGVYVGNGLAVDARSSYYDMCYGSVSQLRWVEWFKIYGVSYPTTGWVLYNGDSYYYENGQYVVNTSRTLDGVKYTFGSDGVSNIAPPSSAYSQTDYSTSSNGSSGSNTSKPSKNDGILRVGSEGAEVKKLQNALISAGYYNEDVTGYFGQYTESCVKQFQKDMGLLVDGEVGPYTWAALESYEAPTEKKTEAPTEKKTEPPTAASTYEQVTEEVTDFDASAEAEPETEKATDAHTENETAASTEKPTEAPTPAPTEPPKVDKLAMGGEGTKVSQLQSRLAELRYYFGDIDGVFDDETYNAMQAYFAASELKPVEEMTDEQFAVLLSDAAVKSPEYMNLQLGYTGTDVTALQKLLIEAGYMNGEASGIFDEKTQDAVKLAQANFALEVDGIADNEFISALEAQIDSVKETEPETETQTEDATQEPTQESTQEPTGSKEGDTTVTAPTSSGNSSKTTNVSSNTQTQGKGTAKTGSATTFIWISAILFFISILSLAVFTTQGTKKGQINRYRK
ncbi:MULTISPECIES: peptidoglycan-binding protein [unclassified Ruminococcus]|uniref:C40 family peptidase n=1 Tax=unclassified Ruminococcus TaxID=2608920 RepID=UPI00210E7909|nr:MULTISPECIES: peptidoglycan-binding protein [unclassified Ruminococcus]MCQ4022711.1 hypothetical protein [Ruminococcus sp. zg-924]MCQ4114951.1 hypothetical protein [Ruminococcus sp. zg-921]